MLFLKATGPVCSASRLLSTDIPPKGSDYMLKRFIFLFAALVVSLSTFFVVLAHSGGTDSDGGHYNGDYYHYHHGYPAHQHVDGVCPYDSQLNNSGSAYPDVVSITKSDKTIIVNSDKLRYDPYKAYRQSVINAAASSPSWEGFVPESNNAVSSDSQNTSLFCLILVIVVLILFLYLLSYASNTSKERMIGVFKKILFYIVSFLFAFFSCYYDPDPVNAIYSLFGIIVTICILSSLSGQKVIMSYLRSDADRNNRLRNVPPFRFDVATRYLSHFCYIWLLFGIRSWFTCTAGKLYGVGVLMIILDYAFSARDRHNHYLQEYHSFKYDAQKADEAYFKSLHKNDVDFYD